MTHTTFEQSKALMHLGLDEKTADLYYQQTDDAVDYWEVHIGKKNAQNDLPQISCWSAESLLELLPDDIYTNDTVYYLHTWKDNTKWYIQYILSSDMGDELAASEEGELINSLFKMIIWLLTNKLI